MYPNVNVRKTVPRWCPSICGSDVNIDDYDGRSTRHVVVVMLLFVVRPHRVGGGRQGTPTTHKHTSFKLKIFSSLQQLFSCAHYTFLFICASSMKGRWWEFLIYIFNLCPFFWLFLKDHKIIKILNCQRGVIIKMTN